MEEWRHINKTCVGECVTRLGYHIPLSIDFFIYFENT